MKPSLQLRIGQQLTMTPQLQQAIRLLQLSTLDLQQEIQQALESNPLLEQDESTGPERTDSSDSTAGTEGAEGLQDSFADAPAGKGDQPRETGQELQSEASTSEPLDDSQIETSDALNSQEMKSELPVDSTWDELYSASSSAAPGPARDSDNEFPEQGAADGDLHSHLLWQMELTPMSETDRAIATAIIDAIADSGYLTQSCEELCASLGLEDLTVEEVEAVRKRVQQFDPVGVASLSLCDCLNVQLGQFTPDTPWLNEARELLGTHLALLEKRDYRQLQRKMGLSEAQLRDVIRLIQSLDPRPGSQVQSSETRYIIPDVAVRKVGDSWQVELNPDSLPRLRINSHYAAMSRQTRNKADGQYIRNHLQEARWFLRSIESRNDTLLKVARCIVDRQGDFLDHGDEAMKPMVLADVAEAVEMHESTISRVTTAKYLHTPRGIYELKYFFSSHVATDSGGECSSTAIRALIKKLVAAENCARPLSDNKIAELLAEQGIRVARRTIAKYRESLGIPSSSQRKRLV